MVNSTILKPDLSHPLGAPTIDVEPAQTRILRQVAPIAVVVTRSIKPFRPNE